MNQYQLGNILRDMYNGAPKGYKATNIHLFGIKYSDTRNDYSVKEIVKSSGLNESYVTEVNKGIKLSRYVEVKNSKRG
ncbi:hypothetical protein RZN22_07885 [Bacillaceae bacterium S4-13-58]